MMQRNTLATTDETKTIKLYQNILITASTTLLYQRCSEGCGYHFISDQELKSGRVEPANNLLFDRDLGFLLHFFRTKKRSFALD